MQKKIGFSLPRKKTGRPRAARRRLSFEFLGALEASSVYNTYSLADATGLDRHIFRRRPFPATAQALDRLRLAAALLGFSGPIIIEGLLFKARTLLAITATAKTPLVRPRGAKRRTTGRAITGKLVQGADGIWREAAR